MKDKGKRIFLNCVVVFVLIIVIILIAGQKWKSIHNNYQIITNKEEFEKVYSNYTPDLLFIDLRDEDDYEKGHIDMFLNIPFKKESSRKLLNFLEKNKYKNKTIVLMCYSSKRSSEAFNSLVKNGYGNIILINMDSNELMNKYSDEIVTGPCNCLD